MKFISTRKKSPAVSLSEALEQGLAPDGGLYVPEKMPRLDVISCAREWAELPSYAVFAERMLQPFFEGDRLSDQLSEICKGAFHFPLPLEKMASDAYVLELFHGPTAAFKDVGAGFLAECFSRLNSAADSKKIRRVLVATSGDTGGAVAGAFFNKPGFEVWILFPKERVSARQEKQLTAWGGNVRAFSVHGTFDDCQRVVKEAFSRHSQDWNLVSANSINLGRLLPQSVYYAISSVKLWVSQGQDPRRFPHFIIPSGNLGNALAAFWAKNMGFPIGKIILATNANRPIPDFFETGVWKAQPTRATLANAMDVGNPSNMERLFDLCPGVEELRKQAIAFSASDSEIALAIEQGPSRYGMIWCPHTAAAVVAYESLISQKNKSTHDAKTVGPYVLVATAHPAKFESIVEPRIGKEIPVPRELAKILNQTSKVTEIQGSLESLEKAVI
jgi:threonine synthase